jgi:uncharacterized protein (DUF58 family)
MIRPRGIGVVLAAGVVFVLAGVTRVGWLFVFDAVLWGTVVVSLVMPWLATGKLRVQRRVVGWDGRADDPAPMEGDAVEFEVRLENRGILPSMFVNVHPRCGGQVVEPYRERIFMTWLGRRRSALFTTKVSFDKRGLHRLPSARLDTCLPFGLVRLSRRVKDTTPLSPPLPGGETGGYPPLSGGDGRGVLVLPRVYPMRRLGLLSDSGNIALNASTARMGEQVAGSRAYVAGDSWQRVHWRNTARAAQLQVKQFERNYESAIAIALDLGMAQHGGGDALEHGIRLAASAGDFVCRSGGVVYLLAASPREEAYDRARLLEELALLQDTDGPGLPELLGGLRVASDVFAIVLDTDAEGISALAGAAGGPRGVAAVVLSGFDLRRPPADVEAMRRAGALVVECRPGGVPEALSALEGASLAPGRAGPNGPESTSPFSPGRRRLG